MQKTTTSKFPEKAVKVLFKPKRTKVLFGGRGSGKSFSVAKALVIRAHEEKTRILCTRELQLSIKESVWKLLSDIIHEMELDTFFTINKAGIYGENGSEFLFDGLKNNPAKIKSTEGIDIAWVEEAESITDESWDLLYPTIRKDGSEIWVVFNPRDELDATYLKFIAPYINIIDIDGEYENEHIHVMKMNYTDNPWFPAELKYEMALCEENDYKKYLHIWLGEPISDYEDSIIDPLWVRASIDAHIKLGFKAQGVRSMGFDPADQGKDSKAYCIRHGSLVTHAVHWHKGDVSDAIDMAFNKAEELRVTDMVYDQIGIGAAVKDYVRRLQGREQFTVTGFGAADIPENPSHLYMNDRRNDDVFRNRRAQAFWMLRDRFEKTFKAVEKGEYIDPDELISLGSGLDNLKN